jgi:hypothetical protein
LMPGSSNVVVGPASANSSAIVFSRAIPH